MDRKLFFLAFLCETIGLLPYRAISYYPFRRQLRFPWQAVTLIIVISQTIQSLLYAFFAVSGRSVRGPEALAGLICFVIYFSCIQADHWKVLFLYIFVMDYIMVSRGIAFFAEAWLFSDMTPAAFTFRGTFISVAVFAVTAPFMLWFLRRTKYRVFQTDAPFFWRTIWLLPAFTTCIVLMFTWNLSADKVRQMNFFAARVLLLLSMFVVYYVLLMALDGIRESAAAEERAAQQDQLLALQRAQYEQLSLHMDEIRRARHDLNQHLKVINIFLQEGNKEALKKYISEYSNSLSLDVFRSYCNNYAVNTIVSYYANQAEAADVDLFVRLSLPKHLPVNESEFCALLGNLLANAIAGCRESNIPRPFIKVNCEHENGRIVLTVDNCCRQAPLIKDGRFLSTKHEGYGTGTESVKAIAEKYNGWVDFKYEDEMFYASAVLYGA